jgi:DNA-binding PadR family transcriptional regulator
LIFPKFDHRFFLGRTVIYNFCTYSSYELNIFEKARKMNRLDKEIMLVLLTPQQSVYGLEKNLKESNYATVWRHIKKLQKEGLLTTSKASRKNGKPDKRRTEIPSLTIKGIATLLIKGDLQKEEITLAVGKLLEKDFSNMPLLLKPYLDEIFTTAFLKMKPKVNLEFFDEEYFKELLATSFAESFVEITPKINVKMDVKKVEKYHADLKKRALTVWQTQLSLRPPRALPLSD